jgi:hypothetical protein
MLDVILAFDELLLHICTRHNPTACANAHALPVSWRGRLFLLGDSCAGVPRHCCCEPDGGSTGVTKSCVLQVHDSNLDTLLRGLVRVTIRARHPHAEHAAQRDT